MCDGLVGGVQSGAGIHHEQYQVGLVQCGPDLAHGVIFDAFRLLNDAARVHHEERPVTAQDLTVLPVAGQSGEIGHQGIAGLGEKVEEG